MSVTSKSSSRFGTYEDAYEFAYYRPPGKYTSRQSSVDNFLQKKRMTVGSSSYKSMKKKGSVGGFSER